MVSVEVVKMVAHDFQSIKVSYYINSTMVSEVEKMMAFANRI